MFVNMDKVSVMAAYSDPLCVCVVHCTWRQNLNTQLYWIHLQFADQCNSVWQHSQNSIEIKLNQKLDTLYQKLNKKSASIYSELHTHTHTMGQNMLP